MSYLCGLQKIEKIQFCRPEDLVDKIKELLDKGEMHNEWLLWENRICFSLVR